MNTATQQVINEDFLTNRWCQSAYGSPMTKSLPALIDGIKPSDPTSAAAASLYGLSL